MKQVLEITAPLLKRNSATILLFHGASGNGKQTKEWIRYLLRKELEFPHIKIVYPTAPLHPYTPFDGRITNVWYDRDHQGDAVTPKSDLSNAREIITRLIASEEEQGIPPSRILMGGFSMGAALALCTGYHWNTNLKGIFALSTSLNDDSRVYEALKNRNKDEALPELIMYHGDRDAIIPFERGLATFNKLKSLGVPGEFFKLERTYHEMKGPQWVEITKWMLKLLPPLPGDV